MNKKLQYIITRKENKIIRMLLQDQKPLEIHCDANESELVGSIYVARVRDIVKYLNAAFVEYQPGKVAFYSLLDHASPVYVKKCNPNNPNLAQGDEILVQISKDAVKTKDPVATTCLSFTGRYLVLTVGKTFLGISGKITDQEWKQNVKKDLSDLCSKEYGFIVRTNAYETELSEIKKEAKQLKEQWEELKQKAPFRSCYSLLQEPVRPFLLDLLNVYGQSAGYEMEKVVTDDPEIYNQLQAFVRLQMPQMEPLLQLYEDNMVSLSNIYRIDKILEDATRKNVWLKSGGYLVVEPTEALTVIDVNTGKMNTKQKNRTAIRKLNLEAAKEIAHTLRLRNISGMIVVDFVNMEEEEDNELLLLEMRKYVSMDPVKTTVLDMTPLGLVELTRKKVNRSLLEQLAKK